MLIPKRIFSQVEGVLRVRDRLEPEAKMALYKARRAADGAAARRIGKQQAQRMVRRCEKRLEAARQWQAVFALLDRTFPAGSEEGKVAALLYGEKRTQEEICALFQCTRQTVRRRRDNYVCHCALFAAAAGLIQIREDEHDADR